MFINSLLQM